MIYMQMEEILDFRRRHHHARRQVDYYEACGGFNDACRICSRRNQYPAGTAVEHLTGRFEPACKDVLRAAQRRDFRGCAGGSRRTEVLETLGWQKDEGISTVKKSERQPKAIKMVCHADGGSGVQRGSSRCKALRSLGWRISEPI